MLWGGVSSLINLDLLYWSTKLMFSLKHRSVFI